MRDDNRVQEVAVRGDRYDAEVPDTLDLAQRGEYAINVLTRAVCPQRHYAIWQQMAASANPPFFGWANWLTYKWVEALVLMRAMSGSELNLDVERAMMQALVDRIGQDGHLYYPEGSPDQPPDTEYPVASGRMIISMATWWQRDGDDAWIDRIRAMAHGLCDIAIPRYDYVYYPLESGWAPDGGWRFTGRGGGRAEHFPYTPPDEPAREQQGHEGTVKFEIGTLMRSLIRAYRVTGEERFVETAGRLAKWCLLPSLWEDGWEYGVSGPEHGLFAGHFRGNITPLRGLLDYAVTVGDERIKNIVREAYEHARKVGLPRTGWFPGWVTPERFGRAPEFRKWTPTCALSEMVGLAKELSDAGVGDYWDDIDCIVRNQYAAAQFTDVDRLKSIAAAAQDELPQSEVVTDFSGWGSDTANVIERMVGGFGGPTPTFYDRVMAHGCCTGNGSIGLYYAWDSIIREADGMVTVNLLLNRTSPSVDVDSFLPYEGVVRVRNKSADSLAVRIPGWVDIAGLQCAIEDTAVAPRALGRYLLFGGLRDGQVVELRFDVPESTGSYTLFGEKFNFEYRGSTVIGADPSSDSNRHLPLYDDRSGMGEGPAPMVRRQRFVANWLQGPRT